MSPLKLGTLKPLLSALLLVACGEVVVEDPNGTAGAAGAPSGGGGAPAPLTCDDYADEPGSGDEATLTFRNERDEVIYLVRWAGCPMWGDLYTMEAPSGTNVGPGLFGANCMNPWASGGCTDAHVTAIAPGGAFPLDVGMAVYEEMLMPEDCLGSSGSGGTIACVKHFTPQPGTYVFHGYAATAIEGCDGDMADSCPCAGPAEGYCEASFWSAVPAGEPLTATAAVDYPASLAAELLFE